MRLFIALSAQPSFLNEIRPFLSSARRMWPGVKWVSEEQIHLTVKFLGDAGNLSCIIPALERVRFAPFEAVTESRLLFLGKEREVRVIALKLDSLLPEELFKEVEEALAECGIPRETRPFLPHITLGRIKEKVSRREAEARLEGADPLPRVSYPCPGMRLYESILRKEGPEYILRRDYPFVEGRRI
ncbi:MAG TPA: RNA 2',3'-cyclic phosphodiesterase [Candidatus Mcinerneyibacteriales bacterium]|nr:RNA 2',3'-cyclic phosphodiesterase [Candidatus Mcinerneyibacteriales bacterium]HPE20224.1 RNA 2',3'-cyclic phosphodiesterase [Candidatus Mcinerneyibacteriales bacterium]HPQ90240.1 RNA 2',3'-cyclic phosphodiesterase [Candidatus Mcinerneyibacteriales bacterium]